MSSAANYSAERATRDGVEVIRLADQSHKTEVTIVPSYGNNSVEMKVNGKNIFWFPATSFADLGKKPVFAANPFLAPWANRLDHDGFYANGKHYSLDANVKNFRTDFGSEIDQNGLDAVIQRLETQNSKPGAATAQKT